MRSGLLRFVEGVLRRFNISLTRSTTHERLRNESRASNAIALLLELPTQHKEQLLKAVPYTRSQFGQDLFVLSQLGFKKNGFFVEFGATNGIDLSNTYLLEREFGWTGIVSEPARSWHKDLKRNRSCHVETNCVWSESNVTLKFNEASDGEFSTIDSYSFVDCLGQLRRNGRTYQVTTISLEELLDKYNAPKMIDYLSIDTEGSEFDILKGVDFSKYQFRVITCEHNFAPNREKIFSLLTENGYVQKFEGVSGVDDWYVRV
jgi:FkbM family methyltransferase